MRRVLILNDQGAPTGGAELLTLSLREGLRSRGLDARILASTAGSTPASFAADYTCTGSTSGFRNMRRLANPSARRALAAALHDFRPDVVHLRMFTTQLSPLVLPLLAEVPTVYHASWYAAICPNGLKLLPGGVRCDEPAGPACLSNGCFSPPGWAAVMGQRALMRRWWSVVDRIVANSAAVGRALEAEGLGPVEVIPNGVPIRAPRPPLSDPPTVAYAGRLSPEKGVDVLVRAFSGVARVVPDARLVLAGDGPDRSRLEAEVVRAGLVDRVDFLGHVSREALESRLDPAWVQVIPSRVAEPFGLAAAEAMMRGTAVVATDGGGVSEIVVDGLTGTVVPPGAVDPLASALTDLLTRRDRAETMGQAGRERAIEHFGHERFVDRFARLYQTLCSEAAA